MNLKKNNNNFKNVSKRFWKIWIISIILIYLTLAPSIFTYLNLGDNSNAISNQFLESEIFSSDINVPFFSQKDPQWADDDIFDEYGVYQGDIKDIGCAMTSSAMLLKYYGMNTDPGLLNNWLIQNDGYASGGLLYWSKPAEYSGGMVSWIDNHLEDTWFFWDDDYNDYYKLKSELDSGYPVIVQVDSILATPDLEGHWVVVTNFLGGDIDEPANYRINDPWDDPQNPNKLLSHYYDDNYDNTIFSLRFYHGQIAQNNAPNVPSNLNQYKSDGYTMIPEGGTNNEDSMLFKANIVDPDGDDVYLEIELRQINEPFQNQPTGETISGPHPSGSTISISRGWLSNAAYHWQCRARDSEGANSDWIEFGNPGNVDFYIDVHVNNAPSVPYALQQLKSEWSTYIPEGGTTNEDTVVLDAIVTDPDGDDVILEIELRQFNEPFQYQPTSETISSPHPSGSRIYVSRGWLSNADYHWQCRARDSNGAYSGWAEFGTPGNIDFTVDVPINNPPFVPISLQQYKSDGITPILEGDITNEDLVVFQADVSDPEGDDVYLEVELRQIGEPFQDQPTLETISGPHPSGSTISIPRGWLSNADYHWQCRARDSNGAYSGWVEFGSIGNVDFTVYVPPNNQPRPPFVIPTGPTGHIIIPEGGTIQERSLMFHGWANDPDGDDVRLEIELRDINEPFIDIPTYYGKYFSNNTEMTLLVEGLVDNTYHWQARACDDKGATTSWTPGYQETFTVEASFDLYITSSLNILENSPYYAGQSVNAEFTIENRGTTPITDGSISIMAIDPDNQSLIFGLQALNLNPGESYNYKRVVWLEKSGYYYLYCAYKTFYGAWKENVPTDPGISNDLDVYVEVFSIEIHSNYDWQMLSDTTNFCRGTGTEEDPYILSHLTFDASTLNYGILIENTDVHFVIEWCTIFNAQHAAIRLYNVEKGKIIRNDLTHNHLGLNILYSRNLIITSNNIEYNDVSGIDMYGCQSNSIYQNIVSHNNGWGMFVYECDAINIINNTVNYNAQAAILVESDLDTTENNVISVNVARFNGWNGIFLERCVNSEISRNELTNNNQGIKLFESDNNLIFKNTLKANQGGLGVENSYYNILYLNSFSGNFDNMDSQNSYNFWNSQEPIVYYYAGVTYENYVGNYWDDYYGSDMNYDGIGETNYPIDGEYDYYPLTEIGEKYYKSSKIPSLFNGLYLEGTSEMSYQAPIIARIDYSDLGNDVFRVDLTSNMGDGAYEIHHKTRITLSCEGVFNFGTGVHSPFWIFPDVKMDEIILFPIDGDGDHLFRVVGETTYSYDGTSLEVWVLDDLSLPDGYIYCEKNTGLLVYGMVYFGGGVYHYTFSMTDTNAQFGTINKPPNDPVNLYQLESDGITLIQEGGMTFDSTIIFKSYISDPDGDHVRLEIELSEFDQPFTGQTLLMSDFMPSGSEVIITRPELIKGDYHWRYRVMDSRGSATEWKEYGIEGNADLIIEEPMIKLSLPAGWSDYELFYPYIRRSDEDQNKFEIEIYNRKDMWYIVNIYTRQNGGQWQEYIPRDWLNNKFLNILLPRSGVKFEYYPKVGEEIKIEVINNLNEELVKWLYCLDIALRTIFGFSLSTDITDPEEALVKLVGYFNGPLKILGEIIIGQHSKATLRTIKEIASAIYTNWEAFVELTGEILPAQLLTRIVITGVASALLMGAPYVMNWIIYVEEMRKNSLEEPFMEEIILTPYISSKTVKPNLWVIESLELINDEIYYVGEKLKAEFIIENRGNEKVVLKTLTIRVFSPGEHISDFNHDSDLIIDPHDIYHYKGEFILRRPGTHVLLVTYETYDHYWEVDVSSIQGAVSGLEIFVNPIPDDLKAWNLACPANIRIIDSQGRVTGFFNGEIYTEIPHSIYHEKIIVLYNPSDSYISEIDGYENGDYNLTVVNKLEMLSFKAINMQITSESIHQYIVNWEGLSQDEEGVNVAIDSDGDGIFEQEIIADEELTFEEFELQTECIVDFDPDTLNKKSKGKWVTVYIELPNGFDVNTINLETVMLNGEIYAESSPFEIEDYDNDGIYDLMVKFSRAEVINLLPVGDEVEITISGNLADGSFFKGTDTIQVKGKEKKNDISLIILSAMLISMISISLINKKFRIFASTKKIFSII